MLGLEGFDGTAGDDVPPGWHFALLGAETPRRNLRPDGFPGLGIPMPNDGTLRLVAGGRTVSFGSAIPLERPLIRSSSILPPVVKETSSGPLKIVTVEHTIREVGAAIDAVSEQQTYLLLSTRYEAGLLPPAKTDDQWRMVGSITPDSTMLFQFSALSFNSHRIHLDREYARSVEGYPDLVVNGGVTTLLMTEIARRELGLKPVKIKVANKAPLFCDRPITFTALETADGTRLRALNEDGHVAAEMDITTHGI